MGRLISAQRVATVDDHEGADAPTLFYTFQNIEENVRHQLYKLRLPLLHPGSLLAGAAPFTVFVKSAGFSSLDHPPAKRGRIENRPAARLTFQGGVNLTGAWAPDRKRIAFQSTREGTPNIFWQLADGSGGLERLTTSEYAQFLSSWSPGPQLRCLIRRPALPDAQADRAIAGGTYAYQRRAELV
jgi:hypothetical protein